MSEKQDQIKQESHTSNPGPVTGQPEHITAEDLKFSTISNHPVKRLYTPEDLAGFDHERDLGDPGNFPFTRGIHSTMYRHRLWTMRQFSGFGTARQTNERYKYLLAHGTTGLSVAFQFPTLNGYDSDHPISRGEVGKCGVAIDSLEDMEILFDEIPLDRISTSMTINAPAAMLLSMYLVNAEKQGVSWNKVSGTIQNDILKEYMAQKSYIYPPEPSLRIIGDIIEYCSKHVPRWNTISISGYHIREAGSTAAQELAFTLADGLEYVKTAIDRGLHIDECAPRLSFFFDAHNDLFEEVAKFRAARRMWARFMKERYKASERSCWLRFHTQTAGCSLTAQQPYNNIIRVTIQALAGVLGGTQSLHTNSMDETLALPTEEAVTIAVRTQQILAHESGVANTVDPLAGSYFVEKLTCELEEEALEYIKKIEDMGGMVTAIEKGYPQREIQEAAYRYQKQIEAEEKSIVGVNKFADNEPVPIEILKIDQAVEEEQVERLRKLRESRDNDEVKRVLENLQRAAHGTENCMPCIIDCVRAYVTLGEICGSLKDIFGEFVEPKII